MSLPPWLFELLVLGLCLKKTLEILRDTLMDGWDDEPIVTPPPSSGIRPEELEVRPGDVIHVQHPLELTRSLEGHVAHEVLREELGFYLPGAIIEVEQLPSEEVVVSVKAMDGRIFVHRSRALCPVQLRSVSPGEAEYLVQRWVEELRRWALELVGEILLEAEAEAYRTAPPPILRERGGDPYVDGLSTGRP